MVYWALELRLKASLPSLLAYALDLCQGALQVPSYIAQED